MLRLDTTTRSLEITLSGAVTTNQLPVVVCYSDQTASTYNGNTQLSVTNDTTPVTVASAPGASTNRDIDYLSVWNRDTAPATVILTLNDNATLYIVARITLGIGEALTYTHGEGWRTLSASGQLKTVIAAGSVALSDISAAVALNSINNGNNIQTWNWTLTTAATAGFRLAETVASTGGSGAQYLLDVGTIAASTANPIRIRAQGADIFNVTNVGVVTLQGADQSGLPGRAITVRGGDATSGNNAGGALTLTGGAGSGNQPGGAVAISGGTTGTGAGSAVTITAGASGGSNAGGLVTIAGGAAGGTGTGGNVIVQGGTPNNGNGGSVNITAAAAAGANNDGGNVTITAGADTGSGAAGYVNLATVTGTMLFVGTTGVRVGANVALTNPAVSLSIDGTDAVLVPLGTTAQRPTGVEGYLRYNSTTDKFEGFENSAWRSFVTASAGSATLELYRENFTGTPTIQATGTNAQAFGDGASASLYGAFTDSNGSFAAVGDAQTTICVLRCTTTNTAVTTEMFLDGAGATQRMVLPNDSTWTFDILVTARRTDANDSSAGYRFVGVIDRNATAGSTALVGTVSKTVLAEDTAAYDCNVNADTTNGALRIQVNGTGTHTIRWVARVTLVEVTG